MKHPTLHIAAISSAALALGLGFSLWADESRDSWITPAALNERMAQGNVLVLDVRTSGEFAAGHLPGALNVPYDDVGPRLAEIRGAAGERQVVLYCRSGRRAGIAARVLERGGIGPLLHLDGQLAGWRASGLPVERGAARLGRVSASR